MDVTYDVLKGPAPPAHMCTCRLPEGCVVSFPNSADPAHGGTDRRAEQPLTTPKTTLNDFTALKFEFMLCFDNTHGAAIAVSAFRATNCTLRRIR